MHKRQEPQYLVHDQQTKRKKLRFSLFLLMPFSTAGLFCLATNPGYVHNANALIGKQFLTEARASLPGILETPSPETIFDGMELQRLHHDQQVPERE